MDNLPFLTLHAAQIKDIAAGIEIPDQYIKPNVSPKAKEAAIDACAEVGISVPPSGAFDIAQLDAEIAKRFPPSDTQNIERRLKFKSTLAAGGLILEKSNINKK
jgi:hypothetical protein